MSDTDLYVIELDGDGGDATTIRRLLQCTCSDGVLDVLYRDITDMRKLVRCKECVHRSKNPLVGCGWICSYFGFPLPDRTGFCAWGEMEEGEHGAD